MDNVQKLFEDFKKRIVEVECDCNDEKRSSCIMYPEYCDGVRKEVVDLVQLMDESLTRKLLEDKDKLITDAQKEAAAYRKELENLLKELIDRGVISSWYFNGTYHWDWKE